MEAVMAAVSAFVEQRDDLRMAAHAAARFEAPHAIFTPSGPALLEELSACGLRLRTESRLHPDEELIVTLKGEPFPLHARVVWVQEGPPRGGHKTWSAGCRLHPDSIGRVHAAPSIVDVQTPFPWGRALAILGGLGVVALLVYLYTRFAMLMGGG
jgi:hypothetical protein